MWLRIVAGIVFVAAAIWYWRRPATEVQGPRWLDRIKHITPAAAGAVGVALTLVNPKVVFGCAAAGFAIGTAELGAPATVAALPILAYLVWSHRVDRALDRFEQWLRRNQVTITAIVLLLLGVALLLNGLRAL